jgi:hypothetical protein
MKRLAATLALLITLAAAVPAAGQGCAMCYQDAAASGERGKAALRKGILILFFPSATVFGTILGLLYMRRDATGSGPEPGQ